MPNIKRDYKNPGQRDGFPRKVFMSKAERSLGQFESNVAKKAEYIAADGTLFSLV